VSAHVAMAGQPMLHPSFVEADLNYLAPMTERPRNYTFDPPPGVPRWNAVHEKHRMRADALPRESIELRTSVFHDT
jgi:hypothetical protein